MDNKQLEKKYEEEGKTHSLGIITIPQGIR